ncbi:MAG TPA: hypothetical protein VK694_01440 [Verrucomicrobiae bacterium]|nr:hypothetical protein [Verrucomicrobiae bacterium]
MDEGQTGGEPREQSKAELKEYAAELKDKPMMEVRDLVEESLSTAAQYADIWASKHSQPTNHKASVDELLGDEFGETHRYWSSRKLADDPRADVVHEVIDDKPFIQAAYWRTIYGHPILGDSEEDSGSNKYFATQKFFERLDDLPARWQAIFTLGRHSAGVRTHVEKRLRPMLDLLPSTEFPFQNMETAEEQTDWWEAQVNGKYEPKKGITVDSLSDTVAYSEMIQDKFHDLLVEEVGPENADQYGDYVLALVHMRTSEKEPEDSVTNYFKSVCDGLVVHDTDAVTQAFDTIITNNPKLLTEAAYINLGYGGEFKAEMEDLHVESKEDAQRQREGEKAEQAAQERAEIEALLAEHPELRAILVQYGGHVLNTISRRGGPDTESLLSPVLHVSRRGPSVSLRTLERHSRTDEHIAHGRASVPAAAFVRDFKNGRHTPQGPAPDKLLESLGYLRAYKALQETGEVPFKHAGRKKGSADT